jgi:hypothetical protein
MNNPIWSSVGKMRLNKIRDKISKELKRLKRKKFNEKKWLTSWQKISDLFTAYNYLAETMGEEKLGINSIAPFTLKEDDTDEK